MPIYDKEFLSQETFAHYQLDKDFSNRGYSKCPESIINGQRYISYAKKEWLPKIAIKIAFYVILSFFSKNYQAPLKKAKSLWNDPNIVYKLFCPVNSPMKDPEHVDQAQQQPKIPQISFFLKKHPELQSGLSFLTKCNNASCRSFDQYKYQPIGKEFGCFWNPKFISFNLGRHDALFECSDCEKYKDIPKAIFKDCTFSISLRWHSFPDTVEIENIKIKEDALEMEYPKLFTGLAHLEFNFFDPSN